MNNILEGYMPYLDYQTYYRIAKSDTSNTPVLLLHGGPGSTHNYFELLDPLSKDRDVISYDQLGCGNSYISNHLELWKLDTWMNELESLIDYLHLDSYHLLGQSWGGMLAIAYAIEKKPAGLQSLILSSTLPSSKLWESEQKRMITFLPAEEQKAIYSALSSSNWNDADYLKATEHYMKLHCADIQPNDPECLTRKKVAGTESYMCAWGPNEYTPIGTLKDFDYTDRLQEIQVPSLIINGTNDLCTPYIAKTIYDRIPDTQWKLFQNARHMVFAEYTKEYLELLHTWLKKY